MTHTSRPLLAWKTVKNLVLALIVLLLFGCSDSEEYCGSLIETAASADAQDIMRDWQSQNIHERRYSGDTSDIQGAGGMWPGHIWVDVDFDWAALNLGGEVVLPQIRLVSFSDDVNSVFFGERSGYGLLVRTAGSEDFGVDHSFISWRDDDIAVVCRERD